MSADCLRSPTRQARIRRGSTCVICLFTRQPPAPAAGAGWPKPVRGTTRRPPHRGAVEQISAVRYIPAVSAASPAFAGEMAMMSWKISVMQTAGRGPLLPSTTNSRRESSQPPSIYLTVAYTHHHAGGSRMRYRAGREAGPGIPAQGQDVLLLLQRLSPHLHQAPMVALGHRKGAAHAAGSQAGRNCTPTVGAGASPTGGPRRAKALQVLLVVVQGFLGADADTVPI